MLEHLLMVRNVITLHADRFGTTEAELSDMEFR